ncbi:MAG TPA: NADH-quinone oxidoreductase subunit L, partial [Pirellulales bacterium]|nr:NADH-quinone oxidoreductase subunit L [Pirellulales bacterium]
SSGVDAESKSAAKGAVGFERTFTLWQWANIADAYPAHSVHPVPVEANSIDTRPTVAPGVSPSKSRDFRIEVTLRADPLTAIMLAMVTFISTLVAIYSIGYMHGDPGYWRFFSFIGLFVFSMTMLVSVSNFALLYVFWEAVGLCSYLLIGFWYQKPEAVAAGKKAFLVNRVGDYGFALGLFLIWTTYGTLDFHDTLRPSALGTAAVSQGTAAVETIGVLGQTRLAAGAGDGYVGGKIGAAICLLLLLGACGKSAQFPLHVWLPDAMEGPTPVSALIHAATMVTAGVYMIARCTPLFVAAPQAQHVVAIVGCFTALLAGLIAMTQTDLKRVLAYSTISQLGYMFLSLGIGVLPGIVFGMFHLFTHAFFKALLFLGAGSVMHAMGGVIDMRRIGGLRRLLPTTFWTFLIGCLALAGVWPFAGFWSKDGILAILYERAQHGSHSVLGIPGLTTSSFHLALFWIAMFTALLTAFYTFRALFITFFGPEKIPAEAGHHAHESPPAMTIPLVILAGCAAVVGFLLLGGFSGLIAETPSLAWYFVPRPDSTEAGLENHERIHDFVAVASTLLALGGIGGAAFLYLGDRRQVTWLAGAFRPLYRLSYGKFFFDPIYDWLVIRPIAALAAVSNWFDRWVVDGLVDLAGAIPPLVGRALRSLQNGAVQFYALAMILGLLVLIGALIAWPAK